MQPIIEVKNLSKQYRLGTTGTGTISHDLNRWWHRIRGKEDPYLQLGDTNDRTVKGNSDYVWALRNINFEVMPGEVLGIIGRNGAGKSTLLKILSRITTPSTGSVRLQGRVASLLEVGTGMHGELTGRENIFLNGAILGMRRWEIDKKFDEIVDFAGIERYIDTPVKRYSSGMFIRLGFAVAAFLEPEILIVDEVLAVGDADFQKRCIGKMQDVSRKEGRTILFVSHNMTVIQKICGTCLLLHNGGIEKQGLTPDIIGHYLSRKDFISKYQYTGDVITSIKIMEAWVENGKGEPANELPIGEKWCIKIVIRVKEPISNVVIGVGITSIDEVPVNTSWREPVDLSPGSYQVCFKHTDLIFAAGKYFIQLGLMVGNKVLEFIPDAIGMDIVTLVKVLDKRVVNATNASGIILNQMQSTLRQIEPVLFGNEIV